MTANIQRNSIKQLPEHIICQIAAGEVVERPVSVVKELVENAIDAHASLIEIEIIEGGTKLILVRDNGTGIPAAELPLALTRHATSKLSEHDDLYSIASLGFRGEALPSIASVSHFSIETATSATAPLGYFWNNIDGTGECSRQQGTTIKVADLFYNTPGRLKFLKSIATEWGHIYDYVEAMALYYTQINWRLSHNGKVMLASHGSEDITKNLANILGKDVAANLYSFESAREGLAIKGFLSHPNFSRSTNKNLYAYVNGRYVNDRMINHAIVSGYRGLLMKDQYPLVIMYLNIDAHLVDVNVHPAKREVRFANGRVIHSLISEALQQRLDEQPWVKNGRSTSGGLAPTQNQRITNAINDFVARDRPQHVDYTGQTYDAINQDKPQIQMGLHDFSSLNVIGQLMGTYIVCESDGHLILLDQHAAHERIGYEKLKRQYEQGSIASQHLLTPISFDLRPSQVEILSKHADSLESFGLSIAHFGGNTFVIKSYPVLLKESGLVSMLHEMVEDIEREGKITSLLERLDHVFATMACHAQIRANDQLNLTEMRALVSELKDTPRGYHCPHGRPVMVEVTKYEIEKWFKRVV